MSDFGMVYNSFNEMATGTGALSPDVQSQMSVFNSPQVMPKVVDPSGKLRDKLEDTYIGCRGLERLEVPHVTIRTSDGLIARIEIASGDVMAGSKGDRAVVELVRKDLKENPKKYIDNWNKTNPQMVIPIETNKDEL